MRRLWLTDFRNYRQAELSLPDGLTVLVGGNGEGKTNLLEAAGYLATLESFRGAPNEALVRQGAARAVVRGEGERGGRTILVEAEVVASGRGRATLNRQPLRRSADLLGAIRVSVFSPDDLELVGGAPAARRRYLDTTLAALHPRYDAVRRDFERVLRQRNRLLSQAAGSRAGRPPSGESRSDDVMSTLDVWDRKLTETGEALADARADLVERLAPAVAEAYGRLAGQPGAGQPGPGDTPEAELGPVEVRYDAPWRGEGLAAALAGSRAEELRRGVSLVGPHRDDLTLALAPRRGGDGTAPRLAARTHASRGEQRSLALALRLAAHHVVTDSVGEAPLLLLDDVFSELDEHRAQALLDHLPPGQAILTTAGSVPLGAAPEAVFRIDDGDISPVAALR